MKKRADILVFESGLAKSREKARALIMEGVAAVVVVTGKIKEAIEE